MKSNSLVFLLLLYALTLNAQVNLVPNPSFENVTQCPFSLGLEAFISDWKSARETPDYFNSCATWSGASVPSNNFGFQPAFNGNGYVGMLTYRADSSIFTEAISVQLNSPLVIGQKYFVCFKFCLTIESITESNAANNKIGVLFSSVEFSTSSPAPINNFAHVWTDSILADTANWSTFFGSFIADSAYSYLNIGNFYDKPYVDTLTFGTVFGAYYYFDDVCVSTDSLACLTFLNHLGIGDEKVFLTYPNPVTDYFIVQNNQIGEVYDLEIYSVSGSMIYEERNINDYIKKISTSSFECGLLFINIKTENLTLNYKLIKQ